MKEGHSPVTETRLKTFNELILRNIKLKELFSQWLEDSRLTIIQNCMQCTAISRTGLLCTNDKFWIFTVLSIGEILN